VNPRSPSANRPKRRPDSDGASGRSIARRTNGAAASGASPSPQVLATNSACDAAARSAGISVPSAATRSGSPAPCSARAACQASCSAAPVWLACTTRIAVASLAPASARLRAAAAAALRRSRSSTARHSAA